MANQSATYNREAAKAQNAEQWGKMGVPINKKMQTQKTSYGRAQGSKNKGRGMSARSSGGR
jgi:hypothetical protein